MSLVILPNTDITALEEILLDARGNLKVVPAAELKIFSQQQISLFCWKHAIYQIVTKELVDFFRNEIGDTRAIEIGSGNGCFGRALGIPRTDSRIQEQADIRAHYDLMQQPTIKYQKDIERLDAAAASERYKPETVCAAWVTERRIEGRDDSKTSQWGVEETEFAGRIRKYVFAGNDSVHGDKTIIKTVPHKRYQFDWLYSRSTRPSSNAIYVFDFTDQSLLAGAK